MPFSPPKQRLPKASTLSSDPETFTDLGLYSSIHIASLERGDPPSQCRGESEDLTEDCRILVGDLGGCWVLLLRGYRNTGE